MNNAWESYCLLIESNPPAHPPFLSFHSHSLLPSSILLRFALVTRYPPFPRDPSIRTFLFFPSALSLLHPRPLSLFRSSPTPCTPPNRPVQMRAAFSLYPRIKRIVYDKSSGSEFNKTTIGPLENASRCLHAWNEQVSILRFYGCTEGAPSAAEQRNQSNTLFPAVPGINARRSRRNGEETETDHRVLRLSILIRIRLSIKPIVIDPDGEISETRSFHDGPI